MQLKCIVLFEIYSQTWLGRHSLAYQNGVLSYQSQERIYRNHYPRQSNGFCYLTKLCAPTISDKLARFDFTTLDFVNPIEIAEFSVYANT